MLGSVEETLESDEMDEVEDAAFSQKAEFGFFGVVAGELSLVAAVEFCGSAEVSGGKRGSGADDLALACNGWATSRKNEGVLVVPSSLWKLSPDVLSVCSEVSTFAVSSGSGAKGSMGMTGLLSGGGLDSKRLVLDLIFFIILSKFSLSISFLASASGLKLPLDLVFLWEIVVVVVDSAFAPVVDGSSLFDLPFPFLRVPDCSCASS